MTLIARIIYKRQPIYFGDLLLSREGPTLERVDIPAAVDVNAKLPLGVLRSVTGLRQKVNILSDRLIIAWAGSMVQARSAMKHLNHAVNQGARSAQQLGEAIEQVTFEDRNDVSLIGTLLTPDTEGISLEHFSYKAEKAKFGDVEVVVAGTGADDILALIPQVLGRVETLDQSAATGIALVISAALVGHETSTGANVLDWWGGAIEVAGIHKWRFEKLSNILHTIWKAKRVGDRYEIHLVPCFIKYDYYDSALIAQTFQVALDKDALEMKCTVNEHSYRVYTPLLRGPREYDMQRIPWPDLSHKTLCCYVLVEPTDLHLGSFVKVYHSNSGDTPFRVITNNTRQLSLGWRDDLVRDLEEAVRAATRLPSTFCAISN